MTIPTISTLPTAPARTDAPALFISRADAFLATLVTMQSELNTSIGAMNTDIAQANTDATTASAAATNAANSASAAAISAGAALWISGASYAEGDAAISGVDYLTYRANTATSGATDPSASGDWVQINITDTSTDTLSNKTIQAGIFTNGYTEEVSSANTGTSYTINLDNGTLHILTLTGNCTFTFPSASSGKSFIVFLKQDGSGGRSATWPASVKWPSSTAPTLTSDPSKGDKFVFTADGTYWWGSNAGQNYL